MADATTNLPQITNFVPRGPVPYGTPGVPVPQVPVVNNFVYRGPNPAQQGYTTGNPPVLPRVIPAAATPLAATPIAAVAPAPAVPVAPPAAVPSAVTPLPTGPVSATPGEGNPLPPSLRGAANAAGAIAGQTVPAFPLLNAQALQGVFTNGANGGSQIAPGGIEVDRGGTVSRYDQGGNLVSGPGTAAERAYNQLIAANPGGGVGQLGTAYAQAAPAAGGVGMVGGVDGGPVVGGAAGGIRDPQAAIAAGFGLQDARAQNYIGQAMNYVNAGDNIFERATRARFVNGLLNATVGPNNVGQVQGQGQDTLNSALAGVESAGLGANASIIGSQLGYQGNAERVGEAHYESSTGSVPIGTDLRDTRFGPMPVTVYGARSGGMAPSPIGTAAPRARTVPVENSISTDKATGKTIVFRNGQWTPQ